MSNVHKLKPYPFHAWVTTRNKVLSLVRACRADTVDMLRSFFDNHVTEYGSCITENQWEMEQMRDPKAYEQIQEHRRRHAIMKIAEEIYNTGAYSEEVFYDPAYHSRTRRTNIRVLVMNFDKVMVPNEGSAVRS